MIILSYVALGSAGWIPITEVRPAQHQVVTACLSTDWSVWEIPEWPPELACFSQAANNLGERRRWDAFRRAHPLHWSDEAIAARGLNQSVGRGTDTLLQISREI